MININDFTRLSSVEKTPKRSYGKPRVAFKTSKTGRVRMTLATAARNHLIGEKYIAAGKFPEEIHVSVLSNKPKRELLVTLEEEAKEGSFVFKRNKANQYGTSFIPEFEIPDGTLDVVLTEIDSAPAIFFSEKLNEEEIEEAERVDERDEAEAEAVVQEAEDA